MGLLDGDLINPGLVDPVDDCVPQFAHQLKGSRAIRRNASVSRSSFQSLFKVNYCIMHYIILILCGCFVVNRGRGSNEAVEPAWLKG